MQFGTADRRKADVADVDAATAAVASAEAQLRVAEAGAIRAARHHER